MQKVQTTIEYRGKTYPFYRTNRALFNFYNAGHTDEQLQKGNFEALLRLCYEITKDCAMRASTPLSDTFDDFIDNTEPDVVEAFARLHAAKGEAPEAPQQMP